MEKPRVKILGFFNVLNCLHLILILIGLKNLFLFLLLFICFSLFGQIKIGLDYKTETEYSSITLLFKNDSIFEIFDKPKIGCLIGIRKGKYQIDDNKLILKYQKEFAKPDNIETIRISSEKTLKDFMKFDFDIKSNFDSSKKYYGTDLVIILDLYRIVWFFGGHDDIESEKKDVPLTIKLRDTIKLDTVLSKGYDYKIMILMKEKFEIKESYIIEKADDYQLILFNKNGDKIPYIVDSKD